MCEYCANSKSLYYNRDGIILEVYLELDKTLSISSTVLDGGINIEIKYCPICGKKLSKDTIQST